jgi:fluoroquinolone resistance protein
MAEKLLLSNSAYEGEGFSNLDLSEETLRGVVADGCHFDGCTFSEAELAGCRFINCRFTNCDLSLVKVPKSLFIGTEFKDCRASGVDWTAAVDPETKLGELSVRFDGCQIDYSVFFGLSLKEAGFAKCSAKSVDFSEADLTNADLHGTDFEEARFHQTELEGANLVGAKNYVIDPQSNNIRKAKFSYPEVMSLFELMDIEIEY